MKTEELKDLDIGDNVRVNDGYNTIAKVINYSETHGWVAITDGFRQWTVPASKITKYPCDNKERK